MEIVNVRIDERLIHGQVATVWTQQLKPTRIMVVDAAAVKDEIQKVALKMARPGNVKLSILSPKKAAENLIARKYEGDRVFIVTKSPASLRIMAEAGVHFDAITVGNMSVRGECRNLRKTVNVNEQDVADFRYLADQGAKITAQLVPNDPAADLIALL